MIIGLGVDLADIRRIEKTLERFGDRFTTRVFTDLERAKADRRRDRAGTYAKRFAAKEACAKALGTGVPRRGVHWKDLGVVNLASGAPTLALSGGAAKRLAEITPPGTEARIHLTLTDDYPLAQAMVIITAEPVPAEPIPAAPAKAEATPAMSQPAMSQPASARSASARPADAFAAVEDRLGYRFADRGLLERALTHPSYGDGRKGVSDNQRLEFLGDRVLGLVVASWLYADDVDADEGALAPRLNALVRKEACARAAERAGLGEAVRVSKSLGGRGGPPKVSVLGDACEAVIAALYLDGGYEAARAFVERFWGEEFVSVGERVRDAKTALQEWAQGQGLPTPGYDVVERSGPDHRPVFEVEARVEGLAPARGLGGSKQEAERAAAAALLAREGVRV